MKSYFPLDSGEIKESVVCIIRGGTTRIRKDGVDTVQTTRKETGGKSRDEGKAENVQAALFGGGYCIGCIGCICA